MRGFRQLLKDIRARYNNQPDVKVIAFQRFRKREHSSPQIDFKGIELDYDDTHRELIPVGNSKAVTMSPRWCEGCQEPDPELILKGPFRLHRFKTLDMSGVIVEELGGDKE